MSQNSVYLHVSKCVSSSYVIQGGGNQANVHQHASFTPEVCRVTQLCKMSDSGAKLRAYLCGDLWP